MANPGQKPAQFAAVLHSGKPPGQTRAVAVLSWLDATRRDNPRPPSSARRLNIRRVFII
jgi:hypothetical protein